MQAAKGADQAAPIQIRLNISDDLASKLTALHLLLAVKCSHFVNLLMFLFVLAKLLPKSHNLYGNSLDFKLKYMREKNVIQRTVTCRCMGDIFSGRTFSLKIVFNN